VDPSETPEAPSPEAPSTEPDARPGPDLLTIGLLVFFIALIGIVAVLLLLPILKTG
jgi:hypothetical protein